MTTPTILVVGDGRSALEAAREVVSQGGSAILAKPGIRRSCDLRTPGGIEPICGAVLTQLDGSPGRFVAKFAIGDEILIVEADAVILAPESQKSDAGRPGITLSHALADPLEGVTEVAIVLGPRSSRHDHVQAIELARVLRSRSPPPRVTIFGKEILVRGTEELDYVLAQRLGALFVRTARPAVHADPAAVVAVDEPSGLEIMIQPDLLVVAGLGSEAPIDGPKGILDPELLRGNVSMGPVASLRQGVLLCRPMERGLCGHDQLAEAKAAATRAISIARNVADRALVSAKVDQDKCSACLTCVRTCPFHAPYIDVEGKAKVRTELCQSCGCCVAACPSRAIGLPSDEAWSAVNRSSMEERS